MKRLPGSLALWLVALLVAAETLSGTLQWVSPLEISTPRSGMVTEVLVARGERVAAGAALARLEMRGVRAQLAAAQAALSHARAAMEEASRERERTQERYDRTLLSDHDLQVAQIALVEAEAGYREVQAGPAEAQLEAEYSELRAPYPALVLDVAVQPGQTVANRAMVAPMVTVTRSDRLAVRVPASAQPAAGLSPGQALKVRVAGRELDGVVVNPGLLPDPDGDTPRYPVEVHFAPPQGSDWRAGLAAEILLP